MMKISKEDSKKIEALLSKKSFTLQDIVSLLDNLYSDNQIKYHINKYYPEHKNNLVKEYSKGGTKLEYLLKEIFPYDKIIKEFALGERLRVDFVIGAPYNLAFEYDGSQHSEYSSFFHGSKGAFIESKQRDERKEILLKNRGINLIRLSDTDFDQKKLSEIVEQVGYGSGKVVDESLLTIHEKMADKLEKDRMRIKELKKQAELLKPKIPKKRQPIKSEEQKAYLDSIKEKQKLYRKEQYQKQKEWLKQNKKK